MASYYWIKLWMDILADPRVGPLSDRLWRRLIEVFLVARTGEGDGYLPPLESVAWMLRLDFGELQKDLQDLERLTGRANKKPMVQCRGDRWFVTNFAKRQAAVSSTERSKEHRRRQRDDESDATHRDWEQGQSGDEPGTNRPVEAEAEADTEAEADVDVDVEAEAEADHGAATAADSSTVYELLRALGIEDPAATNLAACYWVDHKYVREWAAYTASWKTATDDVKLRSLIARMESRRQVPPRWREKSGQEEAEGEPTP